MRRHQPEPTAWLFTDARLGPDLLAIARRLPIGTGVVFRHHELGPAERRALLRGLRRVGTARRLTIVDDTGGRIRRVHSARELRVALPAKPDLLFISPIFATRSHPEWRPLQRVRAAALVRLSRRPVLALGGMTPKRFAAVRGLGFAGWGGIDGWQDLAPRRKGSKLSSGSARAWPA